MRLEDRSLASQTEDVVGGDRAVEALKNEFPHWFDFHEILDVPQQALGNQDLP
jgi:hypothetical protein